jgi:hypothetical protein
VTHGNQIDGGQVSYRTVWESEHGDVTVWWCNDGSAEVTFSRDDSSFPMDMKDFDSMVKAVRNEVEGGGQHE